MNAKIFLSSLSISFFLLGVNFAWAHAMLEQSSPAKNEALKASPKQITLTFGHPVKLTQFKLTQIKPATQNQNATEIAVPVDLKAGTTRSFAVPVPQLTAGKYQLRWSALSDDGHVMRGTLPFSIENNNAKP